jgi:hypothetical protein
MNSYYAERDENNIWPKNKPTWRGLIGMLYPSDYGYSLDSSYWNLEMDSYGYDDEPYTTSWMGLSANLRREYFLSPFNGQENMALTLRDNVVNEYVTDGYYVEFSARPALYLEHYVNIIDGTGTNTDPYILSLD